MFQSNSFNPHSPEVINTAYLNIAVRPYGWAFLLKMAKSLMRISRVQFNINQVLRNDIGKNLEQEKISFV